ncbi:MAG TPA: hypothetical protein VNQ76_13970, partial [Planctomicrobium sp.]|nr:hypothetical protein [Planctomicrobium sp.]
MNCLEFQTRLEQAVEERSPPTEELRLHASACRNAECRDAWSEFVLLDSAIKEWAIRDWKKTTHQVDFVDQILSRSIPQNRHLTKRQPERSFLYKQKGAIGGSVAVVAMMLLLVWGTIPRTTPVATSSPSEIDGYQELGTLYISWVEGASAGVTGSVTSMLTPATSRTTDDTVQTDSTSWLQHWGEQLRPLEEELDRTFRVF